MKSLLIIGVILLSISKAFAIDPNACKKPKEGQYYIQNKDGRQQLSLLKYDQALALFAELKNPGYKIPYLNAETHCDIRGHKISKILFDRYKIKTSKVFIEAVNEEFQGAGVPSFLRDDYSDSDNRNVLSGRGVNGDYYSWKYHTAPALCVRNGNRDELYVFDLSLFDRPVPYSQWKKAIAGHLSESDINAYSGSMFVIHPNANRPQPNQFLKSELQSMERTLSGDWALHVRNQARMSQATAQVNRSSSTTY